MHKTGHVGVSLVVLSILAYFLFASEPWLFLYGAIVLLTVERVPDIDLKIPGVKHRGFTHTVAFAALCAIVVGTLSYRVATMGLEFVVASWIEKVVLAIPADHLREMFVGWGATGIDPTVPTREVTVYGAAFAFLGVVTHLIGDVATYMGIKPFWPVSPCRVTLKLFRSRNESMNGIAMTVGVLSAITAGYLLLA